MRTKVRPRTGWIALGLLILLTPAPALALTGTAEGVLYEVLESPPAHAAPGGPNIPGAFPPGIAGRLAQATQAGSVVGSDTLALLTGDMEIHAQSRVPVDPTTGAFGVGTVSGVFRVHNGLDTLTAKFAGALDLSLLTSTACSGSPCPFAPTSGTWWTLGKNKTGGKYEGLFLVPFQVTDGVWAYFSPMTGLQLLEPNEFSADGTPLVKLVVTLVQ